MKRTLLALLGAISLSACAQAPQSGTAAAKPAAATDTKAAAVATAPKANTPEGRTLEAIRALNPQVKVDNVVSAPIKGFQQAIVGGQVVYVSDDGKYVFAGGALFDTTAKKNLSENALATVRKDLLKTIPMSERIVFAPANPKHKVAIFTDIDCGYCRKLHNDIAAYNKQGIEIQYLAFPRQGLGSEDYKNMVSVWCSVDRKKALTEAKAGKAVTKRDCKNTVTMQYDVGQRAGLTGTPMIITADGTTIGGYLTPEAMLQTLDKMAADAAKPAGDTKTASTGA